MSMIVFCAVIPCELVGRY